MVKVREDIAGWIMSEHGVPDSKLKVIKQVDDYIKPNGSRIAQYLCECNCERNKQIVARMDSIKNGNVKSCGCLSKEYRPTCFEEESKRRIYSDEKIWTVYIHTNIINGKKYVGITSQKPTERWRGGGSGYKRNKYFWNSIQKYGWNNFKHEIILSNETLEYACKVERCLIKHYKSNNEKYGYNHSGGGDGNSGFIVSEETKEKLRKANIGKIPSEETRHKISIANKGRKKTEEEKIAISKRMSLRVGELNNHYGKKHSEETRRKMSESISKAMADPSVREKIGRANSGQNHGGIVPLYCPELDQYFWGGQDVLNQYGIRHVLEVRNKEDKTAGKHPTTGEKLHWKEITMDEYMNHTMIKEENNNECA